MNKLKTALALAVLPIFMHADGEFAVQDSKNMNTAEQPVPTFIEYHNRMAVFVPWHQVYERIKTDAYYGGVEYWFLPTVTRSGKTSKSSGAVAEAEVRFGYNLFYNGRDHVTPFMGVGAFESFKGRSDGHHSGWLGMKRHYRLDRPTLAYGVVGFLYDHEFSSVVNLGINLKGIVGGGVNKKHGNWGSAVVGFDVAVPFTLRCGRMRHWDVRIEPFNIYLHGSETWMNVFGFRSTIGYRF